RVAQLTLHTSPAHNRMISPLPINLAQRVLGFLELLLAALRQALAGAVDVEGEHRHRRAIGIGLAPLAAVSRALERQRDLARRRLFEHALLERQRIARLRDALRPAPAAARLRL